MMYHRQQNKYYPQRCHIVKKMQHSEIKFKRSNKFLQVNLFRLKSSVDSKLTALGITFILLTISQTLS